MVSSGFSFQDGKQILVSVQKPLGIVLEQDSSSEGMIIVVTQVDLTGSAGRAGVEVGDILVAVQNALVEKVDLDSVLGYIGNGPRVMNLRLVRGSA
jgi:predicted metalloprotease with PDZ domain